VNAIVGAWVREKTCDEVLAALGPAGADVPCARVVSPEELVRDEQLLARGMIERHPHPDLGEIVFHGNPLRFAGADPRRLPLAPRLGEHNRVVYAELGVGDDELASLAERGVV
jgi:crotonobetainyl-CoA:carnitine CoA-transferase CaiB-like acyl-CoA transferase